jgi:hypothetical protein
MIPTNQTWKTLFGAKAAQEYRLDCDGKSYYNGDLYSLKLTEKLFKENNFSIGGANYAELEAEFLNPENTIPETARIDFYIRQKNASAVSDWLRKGTYFIDSRETTTGRLTVVAKDALAFCDGVSLLEILDVPSYPANARTVAEQCAAFMGIGVDNINAVYNGNIVEYPNDLSGREALEHIAAVSGGNFIVTSENKLRLVVLGEADYVGSYKALNEQQRLATYLPVSKVRMFWSSENAFEIGNDSGTLAELDNPWATQAGVNNAYLKIQGYRYISSQIQGVLLDPAVELGDNFIIGGGTVSDTNYAGEVVAGEQYGDGDPLRSLSRRTQAMQITFQQLAANIVWRFTGSSVADVSAPSQIETAHEIPYTGVITRSLNRRVILGESYMGVTIGRQNGFECFYSPDGTETNATASVTLNADLLSFKRKANGAWDDCFYYSPSENMFRLKFYDTAAEAQTKLDINTDGIFAEVSKVYSTKTELQDGVTGAIASSEASLEITAQSIRTDVATYYATKTDMQDSDNNVLSSARSYVEQTALGITSSVAATYSTKTEMQNGDTNTLSSAESKISQSANDITFWVQNNYTTGQDVEAKITIGNQGVLQEVSGRNYQTGAQVSSSINTSLNGITLSSSNGETSSTIYLSGSGITTKAATINFTGVVTFAGLKNGTTTIDGGCIKTGTINANYVGVQGSLTYYLGTRLCGMIGATTGSDGNSVTYGTAMFDGTQTNFLATTSGGARMGSGSSSTVYTVPSKVTVIGPSVDIYANSGSVNIYGPKININGYLLKKYIQLVVSGDI